MKYKMMTAKEAIDYLFETKDKAFDFTFDRLDLDPDVEPSGWYGVKVITLFDAIPDDFFVMGYYGGGATEGYNVWGNVDSSDTIEAIKEFMAFKLQDYMSTWCDYSSECEKICVEIKEN